MKVAVPDTSDPRASQQRIVLFIPPARESCRRFDDGANAVASWNWPRDRITGNFPAIPGADIAALEAAA